MTATYGPCPRCYKLARSIERTTTGTVVTHYGATPPCPITPGEMPVLARRAT